MDPGRLPSCTRLPQPLDQRQKYYNREYKHHGTLRCRVILVIARSDRYPDIQSLRVTATGFRHQDTYPLAVMKALRYLCRIFEGHLTPTPMRFFPPAIRTPVWEARMRSLERRRHEEIPVSYTHLTLPTTSRV